MNGRDEGSTHVLEAVVILSIMFVAIASVSTFEIAGSSHHTIERLLDRRARDALLIWDETPAGTGGICDAETKLEQLIYEGLNDTHELWNASTQKFRPNLDVDLVLDNGRGVYPLHGSGKVVGSGHNIGWGVDQDYILPVGSVNTASGLERQVFDTPAIQWGQLTKLRGEAIRMSINGTTVVGDSFAIRGWAPTAMVGASANEKPLQFSSNLTWSDGQGKPTLSTDARAEHVRPQSPTKFSRYIRLDAAPLADGSHGTVPMDTTLTVTFPPGWSAMGWEDLPSGWENITPTGASFVRAALRSGAPALATLTVQAFAPPDPLHAFDLIHAKLTNGSLGESTLAVYYPAPVERNAPRVLAPTAPYPVRNNSWALFGAVLANGADEVEVTSFDITIPGGYDLATNGGIGAPLFVEVDNDTSTPSSGWRTAGPRVVRWEGTRTVPALQAMDWIVSVRITPDVSAATSIEPSYSNGPNATIRFANGYEETSTTWGKSPGILRFRVPPASLAEDEPSGGSRDGYPWRITPDGSPRTVEVDSRGRIGGMTNTTSYTVSGASADVVSLENAMANATFEVETRVVPLGSMFTARGDLTSLAQYLTNIGTPSKLVLDLYSPPSLGCAPTRSWELSVDDLPRAAVTTTHISAADGIPSVFSTTEDGVLHRIDALAFPLWRQRVSAGPTILEPMVKSTGASSILVGTTSGDVLAFRTIDGEPQWTMPLAEPITSLHYDAATDRVFAGTKAGVLAVRSATGAEEFTLPLAGAITDILPAGDSIYVHASPQIFRLDAGTLAVEAFAPADGPGFALGQQHLLVADSARLRLLDPGTLSEISTEPFPAAARLSAHGDATGDGIDDLVVATSGLTIVVADGSTSTTRHPLKIETAADAAILHPFRNAQVDGLPGPALGIDRCAPTRTPAVFGEEVVCSLSSEPGPTLLVATGGNVLMGYVKEGRTYVARYAPEWTLEARWKFDASTNPTSLAMGAWASAEHAVVIGDSNGRLVLHNDAGGPLMTSTPSTRVGRFSFMMHVPEGGFYGTHLMVARVQWGEQEARLVDWFEVVASEGEPIPRPVYRVALTMANADGT